jgi:DNA-binding NarL/FixJ family response regulator
MVSCVSVAVIPLRLSEAPGQPGDTFETGRLERNGRPLRIVIAEDEAVFALDIQNIIREAGGEVVGVAVRGEDAITLAAALRPDVVLMDVHLMGEMDGIEAARAIKSLRGVAVVFVTAHGDPDTLRRMFEVVPASPIIKPISEVHLREAIVRACR